MGRVSGKTKVKLSAMAKREERWALLFVAAPAVGFLLFMAWPIIFAFLTSLTTWNGAKGFEGMINRFCGFDNYVKLFSDTKFWKTLLTTIIYLIGIPIGMIFAMIFAASIALIGGYTGIKPVIQSAKMKKLKKTGAQIIAKVTHITEDRSVTITRSKHNRNNAVRYPNRAECEAFDPVTGEKYIFSSEAYVSDLQHLVGQLVTVYYDPNDRSRHYVDLNSAY